MEVGYVHGSAPMTSRSESEIKLTQFYQKNYTDEASGG